MEQYYALAASLPFLKFGDVPPVTREQFLAACSAYLYGELLGRIASLSLLPGETDPADLSAGAVFQRFETSLRNELALLRGGRTGLNAKEYVKPDAEFVTEAFYAANAAFSAPDAFACEKILDEARWTRLDELERGHQADMDTFCVYCLKLMILEKRASYVQEKADANLSAAIAAAEKSISAK